MTTEQLEILENLAPKVATFVSQGFDLDASIRKAFQESIALYTELIENKTQRAQNYRLRMRNKIYNELRK